MTTEVELMAKLRGEGFGHAYIWEDGPNAYYPRPHASNGDDSHHTARGNHSDNRRQIKNLSSRGAVRCARGCGALGQSRAAGLPVSYRRAVRPKRTRAPVLV